MNILVTGANGFIGKNLIENLKNIRDGKDRTRPLIHIDEIYEYDKQSTFEDLKKYCIKADFIFHLAGVNRTLNPDDLQNGNVELVSTLLNTLKACNNNAPVMLASSIQASLTGRFADSPYGVSKKKGEEILFHYCEETSTKVLVYRFCNLAGKWCKPNYNSVVATFCYNIANDLPITINNKNTELKLTFIDDLVQEMLDALEGHEHHCEFAGADPIADPNGRFCYVPVMYNVTLGYIATCLQQFHDEPYTILMPSIPEGSFEKKLFSTYMSYVSPKNACVDLKEINDERGAFTEVLKTTDHGQLSINISKPGVTRGEHWHNSKWEIFIVVSGHGLIEQRKIGSDEIIRTEVSGDKLQAVYILPGYTHKIINLSFTDNLVTVMWANEIFDPQHPDTFRELVDLG